MAARKTAKKTKSRPASRRSTTLARRVPEAPESLVLPSGRSVSIVADGSREELQVRSAQGEMELRITLTKDGPVLSLSGARLEINSTDTVAVNCRAFEISASDGVHLRAAGDINIGAAGELRAKTRGKIHLDGELVNLNCGDRAGYPDEESARLAQAAVDRVLTERAAAAPPPQAHHHH